MDVLTPFGQLALKESSFPLPYQRFLPLSPCFPGELWFQSNTISCTTSSTEQTQLVRLRLKERLPREAPAASSLGMGV
jgi:hypothetical protein